MLNSKQLHVAGVTVIDMSHVFVVICHHAEKADFLKNLDPENQNHRYGANPVFGQHMDADFFYFKSVGTRNDQPDNNTAALNGVLHS